MVEPYKDRTASLKSRVLAPTIIAIVLFVAALIIGNYQLQQNGLRHGVERHLGRFERVLNKGLELETGHLGVLINLVTRDAGLQSAVSRGDIDAAGSSLSVIFDTALAMGAVSQISLHSPDRVNILCIHDRHCSNGSGNKISRATLIRCQESGVPVSGVELDSLGVLSLRVVHPWVLDGQLLGYVEFARTVTDMATTIGRHMGVEVMVLVDKSYLSKNHWPDGAGNAGHSHDWDLFKKVALMDHTTETYPQELAAFLDSSGTKRRAILIDLEEGSREYAAGIFPLHDFTGKPIGDVVAIHDVTRMVDGALYSAMTIGGIILLIGVILCLVILSVLTRADQKIKDLHDEAVREGNRRAEEQDRHLKLLRKKQSDLEKAQVVLRNSEERYQELFHAIQEGIGVTDENEVITYCNPALARIFGVDSVEDMVGRSLLSFVSEHQRQFILDQTQLRKNHQSSQYELDIITDEGDKKTILATISPRFDSNGHFLGALGANIDITERKLAEKALKESEERFRTLSVASFGGLCIHDKGIVLEANQGMTEVTGYSYDELIGMDGLKTIAEPWREFVMEKILSGYDKPYEVEGLRKDGTTYPLEIRAKNIPYHGKEVRVTGFWDITERKAAEREIKIFREFVETAAIGFGMMDLEGNITYVNPEVARALGWDSPDQLIGQHISCIYTGVRYEALVRSYIPMILRVGHWTGELTLDVRGGGTVDTLQHAFVIRDKHDKPICVACVSTDITDRKRAECERMELLEKLEKAERMESLGILAGGVAHDLNNMLGPLVGYPELILRKISEESPIRKQIERIGTSARNAADVVQDLLTLARRGRYEMVPTNLNDILKAYQDSPNFTRLCQSHPDVTVKVEFDDEIGNIDGSSPHLSKAVMNLVVNAFDAMPDGGELTIATGQGHFETLESGYSSIEPGKYVYLRVRDTGMGIDIKDLDKIFEPYYSKKEMGSSGSGLGLPVVYGVVKDHRGHYDILSSPGEGTEFVLYFPHTDNKVQNEEEEDRDFGGNESVLVVDDDSNQRQMASELLTALGYRVSVAPSGHEAIRFLSAKSVDIVVLDMIMETGFDGLDTYREILKIAPGQKAIAVSGFSSTDRVKTMQQLGAGPLVRKPYTYNALGHALRQELDKPAVAAVGS